MADQADEGTSRPLAGTEGVRTVEQKRRVDLGDLAGQAGEVDAVAVSAGIRAEGDLGTDGVYRWAGRMRQVGQVGPVEVRDDVRKTPVVGALEDHRDGGDDVPDHRFHAHVHAHTTAEVAQKVEGEAD
jgi:hypothetical protein